MAIVNFDGEYPVRRVIGVAGGQPFPVESTPASTLAGGFVGYAGTTDTGSAVTGTLAFTGDCHGFTFFNNSSYTTVEVSLDGATWLPMGAYGNWDFMPPGAYYTETPLTEIYHRRTQAGSSKFAVKSWEV